MLLQESILGGDLLLPTESSAAPAAVAEGTPGLVIGLIVAFVVAAIVFLPRFLSLAPQLFDSLFRARGSVSLENSVRSSGDRRLMATLLVIPAILMIYAYRLYDAAFLRDWTPNLRLLGVAGVFIVFLLLRHLMFLALRPRRRRDFYVLSRNTGLTYFILLVLILLVTVGLLELFGTSDTAIARALYIETAVIYGVFLVRRAQILALSCNHLRTFVYLCGLEILPVGAMVVSALVL